MQTHVPELLSFIQELGVLLFNIKIEGCKFPALSKHLKGYMFPVQGTGREVLDKA